MATIKCPYCGEEMMLVALANKVPAGNCMRDERGRFTKNLDVYKETAKLIEDHNLSLRGVDLAGEETEDDEKLSSKVLKQGHVKNHRLYRRWILAQLFQMLNSMDRHEAFAERIRWRGIRYMWEVIKNEYHDIDVIQKNGDVEEANRRLRWWNVDVIREIADEFYTDVLGEIQKLKTRKCKGREYKSIPGYGMVFCDEIGKKVLEPIHTLIVNLKSGLCVPERIERLCNLMHKFKESRQWNIKMPTAFINAFKGNGAYFGLRNLLLFHNCRLPYDACQCLDKEYVKDIDALDNFAEKNKYNGWKLLGLFKETVKLNNIDMGKKLHEWRSKKNR